MEPPKRIALYGGTFDPVHAGHMAVARNVSELFALDEVLFVPAHVAPHKRSAVVSSPFHRHAMLALATQHEARFKVSTLEIDAPERPYTVDTLSRFRETLGGAARLFFVMGADSWEEITTWRDWERVLSLTDHIVVTRPGYELSASHVTPAVRARIVDLRGAPRGRVAEELNGGRGGPGIYLTDAVTMDVSATEIRRAAGGREGVAGVAAALPSPVADYIKKYGLYRNAHDTELFETGIGNATH